MSDEAERIKGQFIRYQKAMAKRPSLGVDTNSATAKIINGLTCQIEAGGKTFTADMSEPIGGGKGPSPGTFGRAALGGCLAIGYAMFSAYLDVPLDHIEVEIQSDSDDRGLFDDIGVIPDYSEIRYTVTIHSSAPEADVMRVLDTADAHSPILHTFAKPQNLKRAVNLTVAEG